MNVNDKLLNAAELNDLISVKQAISEGASLNATRNPGNILHIGAISGHDDIVKFALYGGIPVDSQSVGLTPFMMAVESGHLATAQLLLDRGANINYISFRSCSAIHRLAKFGNHSQLSWLLSNKDLDIDPNPNFCFPSPGTPLLEAIERGKEHNAKLLIEKGSNIKAQHWFSGLSAMHLAAAKGWNDIIRLLVNKGADINTANKYNKTPLTMAVAANQTSTVKMLCNDLGADINKGAPLYVAAEKGLNEIAEFLLNKNPYLDAITNSHTALTISLKNGNIYLAQILIERGANVNTENPLAWAAEKGFDDIITTLLNKGALIDTCSGFHYKPPLMIAIDNSKATTANLLIQNGANVTAPCGLNLNRALDYAAHNGLISVVRNLLDRGVRTDFQRALILAITGGHADIAEMLIEQNTSASITAVDDMLCECEPRPWLKSGCISARILEGLRTSLICSIVQKQESIAMLLIENGANISIPDYAGMPLEHAAEQGIDTIARVLITKLPPDSKESAVRSALRRAIAAKKESTAELLIKEIIDVHGGFLCLAAEVGSIYIMQMLFNRTSTEARSALSCAINAKQEAAAKFLITLGTNIDTSYDEEYFTSSPLCLAASNALPSITKLIVDHSCSDKNISRCAVRGQECLYPAIDRCTKQEHICLNSTALAQCASEKETVSEEFQKYKEQVKKEAFNFLHIAKANYTDRITIKKDISLKPEIEGTEIKQCRSIILNFTPHSEEGEIEDLIDISAFGVETYNDIEFKTISGHGANAISGITVAGQDGYVACVYNFDADKYYSPDGMSTAINLIEINSESVDP